MKHNIVLYGNCSASSLVLGYRQLKERYPDVNIFFWAMSAQQYLVPFFHQDDALLTIFDKGKQNISDAKLDPGNIKGGGQCTENAPDDEKLLQLWVRGPKEFRIPLASDANREFVYCFCSTIMPNLTIDAFIQDYFAGRLVCSRKMLEDMILGYMRQQLEYMRLAKERVRHFMVVEGPRRLRHDCDPALYCKADLFFRDTVKKAIRALDVDLLALPQDVYDGDGFMFECFRAYKLRLNDTVHMNADYGAIMFTLLMQHLKRQAEIFNGGSR